MNNLEERVRILCKESIALRVGSDKLNVTHINILGIKSRLRADKGI